MEGGLKVERDIYVQNIRIVSLMVGLKNGGKLLKWRGLKPQRPLDSGRFRNKAKVLIQIHGKPNVERQRNCCIC